MQNFRSQRTGAADAAGEVLLSLVVELSESEALPLALTHFCLCHLAAALLRLYAFAESRSSIVFLGAGMPCVWNFFGCQSGGLPRFVHLGMVLLVLQGFGRCAMWDHKKLLQLRWMEGLGAGEKRWFHGGLARKPFTHCYSTRAIHNACVTWVGAALNSRCAHLCGWVKKT